MWLIIFISQKSCSFPPVFPFCTTNVKRHENTTGWQGDDASSPQVSKTKEYNTKEAMESAQGNQLPFCLPAWDDDKNTRKSLKNWIQITAPSLPGSQTLGKTGNWVSMPPKILCSSPPVCYGGREMRQHQHTLSVPKHCTGKSFYDSSQKWAFVFLLLHLSFLKPFKCPICLSVMGWTVSPPNSYVEVLTHSASECDLNLELRSLIKEGIRLKWDD